MNKSILINRLLIIVGLIFLGCSNEPSSTTDIIDHKVIEKTLNMDELSDSIDNQMNLDKTKIRKILASNDGYYIFGNIEKSILIAKLSFQNKLLWAKKYSSDNELSLVDMNEDNGFLIRGIELTPTYKDNALLIKIDYDGNIIWNKIFGTDTTLTRIFKVINTVDGYMTFGKNSRNLWILKLKKNGTRVWESQYTYPNAHVYYYALSEQEKYVVYSAHTMLKKQTTKISIDNNGNITTEDLPEVPLKIKKEHDRRSVYRKVINKKLYQFVKDERDYIIQKVLDSKVLWEYKIRKEEVRSSRSGVKILETKDGGCTILHIFREEPKKVSSKILKLNKNGVLQWERYFPYNMITKALEIKDGQYVFIGNNSNFNATMNTKNNTATFSMSQSNTKATLVFLNEANIKKTTSTRNE